MTEQTSHASEDGEEFLHFELQGEVFALEAMIVREILDVVTSRTVPGAPATVSSYLGVPSPMTRGAAPRRSSTRSCEASRNTQAVS